MWSKGKTTASGGRVSMYNHQNKRRTWLFRLAPGQFSYVITTDFFNVYNRLITIILGFLALLVRFVTKKFIGDYDPNLEKMYTYQVSMESEMVNFEILDTAGYAVQDVSEIACTNYIEYIYYYIARI